MQQQENQQQNAQQRVFAAHIAAMDQARRALEELEAEERALKDQLVVQDEEPEEEQSVIGVVNGDTEALGNEMLQVNEEELEEGEEEISVETHVDGGLVLSELEYKMETFFFIDDKAGSFKCKLFIKRNSGANEVSEALQSIASENAVSENIYKPIKNSCKAIGMVFYMETGYELVNEINEKIHIPLIKTEMYPKLLKKMFEICFGEDQIEQITVGHEHGDANKKCHLQCCVKFIKRFSKLLNPGKLEIYSEDSLAASLLFMQQAARNPYALSRYCEKEGEFYYLYPDKVPSLIYKKNTKKVDVFSTVVANIDKMSKADARDMLMTYAPDKYICNFLGVKRYLDEHYLDELPAFEWRNPYIPEGYTIPYGKERKEFKPIFDKWFTENCLNQAHKRKKALCLFSNKRALGKTTFARSLVNDTGYILEYNNVFNDKQVEAKKDVYKLLLLDDLKMTKDNEQMWKSLIAGEKTTIRAPYIATTYDLALPCIITTNELSMATTFIKDPLFNTQVIFIEIDEYMGPPETKREELLKEEYFCSENLLTDILREENRNENRNRAINKLFSVVRNNLD